MCCDKTVTYVCRATKSRKGLPYLREIRIRFEGVYGFMKRVVYDDTL
jgi:hypothetical protein